MESPAQHRNVPLGTPYRAVDSPWFWACLFATMALVGLLLIAPKAEVRLRQIEGRFLGRERAAIERSRRADGLEPIDLADAAVERDEAAPRRIVPLWTLATLAGAAAVASGVLFAREVRAARRQRSG